jgi:3-ketosteroid 9alpha-monooxygenase subunit A
VALASRELDSMYASRDARGTMADDGFPYRSMPTGWFQVAWSQDVGPGEVKPLHYFGVDLVLFRTEGGVANVFDAHCPHLGAHVGYGGVVEGDCIRCPFHGWLFDSEGVNAEIPYSDRAFVGAKLRKWMVLEVHDLIFVWHDPNGGNPTWTLPEIPEYSDLKNYYEPYGVLTHHWQNLPMRPQFPAENIVDLPHQEWVHKSPPGSELAMYEADGPIFRAIQEFTAGAGREKTWLTPDGPRKGQLVAEAWGVGISFARYMKTDDSVHVHCHTPIDERHSDERLTVLARRETDSPDAPGERTLRRFNFERYQFERDVVIWEHLQYVTRPPFSGPEVGPYRLFRKWLRQFYADAAEDAKG